MYYYGVTIFDKTKGRIILVCSELFTNWQDAEDFGKTVVNNDTTGLYQNYEVSGFEVVG